MAIRGDGLGAAKGNLGKGRIKGQIQEILHGIDLY